jgi:hypothetical protein
MMSRTRILAELALLALLVGIAPGEPLADGDGAVEDVILLLQERGVIEEADATRIVERNRAYERKETWADRIEVYGKFRGRYEHFWFSEDALGETPRNRGRLRYRLRIGARTTINEHFDVAFRIASGNIARSRNQTLGRFDDFAMDAFSIDQAFLTYHPFVEDAIPLGGQRMNIVFGKMPNLFRSNFGPDLLVWDSDITPEGIAGSYEIEPCDDVALTLNVAYFAVSVNRDATDPAVIPVQLAVKAHPRHDISVGGRLSYYPWRKLEGGAGLDFFQRGTVFGNIPGGLSNGDGVDIGDVRVWALFAGIDDWPILVFGRFMKNFSAQSNSLYDAGREDIGWSAGVILGDKKKYLSIGAGYFWLEANAVPAQFMDSDIFDGTTNGQGWGIFGAKQIYPRTDLEFSLFLGDALNEDILWQPAVARSNRVRLRTDVRVNF